MLTNKKIEEKIKELIGLDELVHKIYRIIRISKTKFTTDKTILFRKIALKKAIQERKDLSDLLIHEKVF